MTNILATIVPPTPQFHKGTPKEYLGSSAYSFFLTANLFAWLLGLITVIVQLALLWMYYKDLRDEEEAMEGMEVEENMTMLGKAVGIAYLILSVGPDLCAAAGATSHALPSCRTRFAQNPAALSLQQHHNPLIPLQRWYTKLCTSTVCSGPVAKY